MTKEITWPQSNWVCISLTEDKTEGKTPQEQAGTEDSWQSRAGSWQSITREETQHLVMSVGSRIQTAKDLQPSIKNDYSLLVCPITFEPLKGGFEPLFQLQYAVVDS